MSQQVGGHLITHIIKNNLENNVTIKLGNNKLIYSNGKRWILENSDLDVAATEIFNLTNENERLHNDLTITEQRCEMLEKQLKESQELKEIALALLAEERKQTLILKREVTAYRDELQKSFKEIIQLRSSQQESKK